MSITKTTTARNYTEAVSLLRTRTKRTTELQSCNCNTAMPHVTERVMSSDCNMRQVKLIKITVGSYRAPGRARYNLQGTASIAIAHGAGMTSQAANSIVINATRMRQQHDCEFVYNDSNPQSQCTGLTTAVLFTNANARTDRRNYLGHRLVIIAIQAGHCRLAATVCRRHFPAAANVEYSFKTTPTKRNVGLIAEEVDAIIPEVVIRNAVNDVIIEGVEYEHLVAPLIKIIQNYQILLQQYDARLQLLEV